MVLFPREILVYGPVQQGTPTAVTRMASLGKEPGVRQLVKQLTTYGLRGGGTGKRLGWGIET